MTDEKLVGVILAGGQARRMGGGDKCQLMLGDRTVLDHVVERGRSQVAELLLSANGDPARFATQGLPVKEDVVPGFAGPLTGILTGMVWAREQYPQSHWLLSLAADTPFFPRDLAARLQQQAERENADIVLASSCGRVHPVFGLWRCSLLPDLAHALQVEDTRKAMYWVKQHTWSQVDFSPDGIDPFFNINYPEDLETARSFLQED